MQRANASRLPISDSRNRRSGGLDARRRAGDVRTRRDHSRMDDRQRHDESLVAREAERMLRERCPSLSGWAVREVVDAATSVPDGLAQLDRILSSSARASVRSPEAYILASARRLPLDAPPGGLH